MSYWGVLPHECDFAFDAIGVNVLLIKQRLLKDISVVDEKNYPEQSIIAHLICLRSIGEQFPKALSVHFGKKDYEQIKASFYRWYEGKPKVPPEYLLGIKQNAEQEFILFERNILSRYSK